MAVGARLRTWPRRARSRSDEARYELSRPRKVLILSANVGEGHAAAARAIAQDVALHDPTAEVTVIDGLAAMGGLIRRVVQDGYEAQLRVAPWSADIVYWVLHHLAPARGLARLLLRSIGARSLQEAIEREDPDVVVSTYPAVTIVLGMLRRRGRLKIPSVAVITDLAGLFFWADRGVDLHLLAYEESMREVERIAGRGSALFARGLVAPPFQAPRDRDEARDALGFNRDGRVVIVSGGGWGVGDLDGSIHEALSVDDVNVVVLAGRNEELREALVEEFASEPRVSVLGFTSAINDLLAAADAMIHSTAGVTCLEARARGCPVVVYGAQVAHIRVNAREMAKREIVEVARSPAELREALERALAGDGARGHAPSDSTPAAAALVARATIRVKSPSRLRLAMPRVAVSVALTLTPVWTFVSPSAFGLHTISNVPTKTHDVALVVRAPSGLIAPLRRQLQADGMDASFAVDNDPRTFAAVRFCGAHGLPEMHGGLMHWLGDVRELHRELRALGIHGHHFYYLRPAGGFSLADYFLASRAGGRAVAPREFLSDSSARVSLHPGDVVVLNVALDTLPAALAAVDRAHAQLTGSGLSAVPLDTLLPS